MSHTKPHLHVYWACAPAARAAAAAYPAYHPASRPTCAFEHFFPKPTASQQMPLPPTVPVHVPMHLKGNMHLYPKPYHAHRLHRPLRLRLRLAPLPHQAPCGAAAVDAAAACEQPPPPAARLLHRPLRVHAHLRNALRARLLLRPKQPSSATSSRCTAERPNQPLLMS